MSQHKKENTLSEDDLYELDLDKKFAEHIKKLNETATISYVNEQGYLVRRSPDGRTVRVKGVADWYMNDRSPLLVPWFNKAPAQSRNNT